MVSPRNLVAEGCPQTGDGARLVARGVALVWLVPALLFNVDWSGRGTWQANTAAVAMIFGSALFIEGAARLRSWILTPMCVAAALFLVYVNTKQANRTLSMAGEAKREEKAREVAGGSQVASQRSHLGRRREAQAKIAGETAVGVLKAELEALQHSDPRVWNATAGCEDVTADRSGKFCGRVASARGKIEAAQERDKIDAELAKLPPPTAVEVPTGKVEEIVVDAYVANTKALLEEAGFKPTERLIRAEEALSKAAGYELLAALGPTCWLAFVNKMAGSGDAPGRPRQAPKQAPVRREPGTGAAEPPLPDDADDLDRCIADTFEDAAAGTMKAKEIRPLVEEWFATRNKPKPAETEIWARIGAKFQRDPNNGRPRYLGLKSRAKPGLRVVK